MKQQAIVVERKVREILHIPLGSLTTTIPVTQRREPHMYEWLSRHRAFLEQVRNHPPKAVILGNSITHYWGGEPEHRNKNGRETWEKVMRPPVSRTWAADGTVSKTCFGVYTMANWMAIRPEKSS